MDRELLIKDRSIARCIFEGYRLFAAQKALIFRQVGMPLLGSSFALAMVVVLLLSKHWVGMAISAFLFLTLFYIHKRCTFRLIAPFPKVGRAIKRVCSHLGSYFTYALLSSIVCVATFALLFLPAMILLAAGHVDHTLVLQGNTEALGFGYWLLTTITLTICFALILFAQIWQTFGVVYLYGAMVARDQAKSKAISG